MAQIFPGLDVVFICLGLLCAVVEAMSEETKIRFIGVRCIMKRLLLGLTFTVAGAGCLSFPEGWPFFMATGMAFICLGLLLAISGAMKKESKDK